MRQGHGFCSRRIGQVRIAEFGQQRRADVVKLAGFCPGLIPAMTVRIAGKLPLTIKPGSKGATSASSPVWYNRQASRLVCCSSGSVPASGVAGGANPAAIGWSKAAGRPPAAGGT